MEPIVGETRQIQSGLEKARGGMQGTWHREQVGIAACVLVLRCSRFLLSASTRQPVPVVVSSDTAETSSEQRVKNRTSYSSKSTHQSQRYRANTQTSQKNTDGCLNKPKRQATTARHAPRRGKTRVRAVKRSTIRRYGEQ